MAPFFIHILIRRSPDASFFYPFFISGWEVSGSGMRPPRPLLMGGSDRLGSWEYRGIPAPSKNGPRSRREARPPSRVSFILI